LENKDFSMMHGMIPLGSCTMKLNAASTLLPLSWPEWGGLHPFAPVDQTQGYQQVFAELSDALAKATGFTAVSLQPNSGAQGEYAGLLVIRAYHAARGDQKRNIALIPSSAHGTNPASAVMAGMQVVVVKADEEGHVDVADLKAKAEQYKDTLELPDGDLPEHARRVRGEHQGDHRHDPRERRPGVHGRRQHERPGGPYEPRRHRSGRVPPEPAQDLRDPARRWRPRHGSHLCERQAEALPARPPVDQDRWRTRRACGEQCPLGQCIDPVDQLRIHQDARRYRAHGQHALRDPQRQLPQGEAGEALPDPVRGVPKAWWRTR
jgi:hypothetical protein